MVWCSGHEIQDVPKLVYALKHSISTPYDFFSCLQGTYSGGLSEQSCFEVYGIQNSIHEEEMNSESS